MSDATSIIAVAPAAGRAAGPAVPNIEVKFEVRATLVEVTPYLHI